MEIKTAQTTQIAPETSVVRYAWGNTALKTWFITKHKRAFLPKGCKLLFTITGEHSNAPLQTPSTYPDYCRFYRNIFAANKVLMPANNGYQCGCDSATFHLAKKTMELMEKSLMEQQEYEE